jgi:ATP-binding cassette subfamily B protein
MPIPLPTPDGSAASAGLPASASHLGQYLVRDENVLVHLPVDLDARLHFDTGFLALTERRLLASARSTRMPGQDASIPSAPASAQAAQSWILRDGLRLRCADHAGITTVELLEGAGAGDARLLASWCCTMARHGQALRLIAQFERQVRRIASGARAAAESGDDADDEAAAAEEDDDAAPSTRGLSRLWRFARPYRWRLLAGFGLTLASTAATLVPPYLTIPLMDDILIPYQNGQPIDLWKVELYLGGLLAASLVAWGLGWARTYLLARVSERIGADLRNATFDHLLGLSLDFFGSKRTGDLMSRIGAETDRINVFLSLHALDFITDLLMMVMTAVILFSINPWLAVATLVPLPLIGWLIHLVRDRLRTGFEKVDRAFSEVTNVLADTIPGVRVVQAFAQERREAKRFHAANQRNLEVNDRINRVWSLFTPTVTLLTEIGLLVVWAFGIWLVAHQSITVGVLTAFLAYIGRFYIRLDSMSRIVSITQKAAAGTRRIFDILDHVSNVPEPRQPVPIPRAEGRIALRGVGFRYGSRTVIRGLSLDIRPGEMIGLVGHSGSGKSTLVNLISRFYDVTAGSIEVDGIDIRYYGLADYRRHIGLVLQEPFLFFGTIAENIAYGMPGATRAEIVAAARAAHAHDFILRLPHGYDSLVGERGQGLSGGERQRISIARALLIDPRILILDEATSAVDTETEKEIQKALDNLVQGRTTIAIAHRLSTLRKADRLVVMDRGEAVEVGPHDELMARQGAYWRLYQAQVRRVDDEDLEDRTRAVQAAAAALAIHSAHPAGDS